MSTGSARAADAPAQSPGREATSTARLSTLDKYLAVWIGVAMAAGLLLGRWVPGIADVLDRVSVGSVSLPIALGLLVMMYPVLAKVRYDEVGHVARDTRTMVLSVVLNWVVGPAVMFALAWIFLADLPEYRTGLIIVGLARCIAMVIIWNDLACGDREAAAVLVAVNSVFQVLAFAGLGWFYLDLLPGWLGLPSTDLDVSPWQIAGSVLVFLGIPLAAGYLTRRLGEARWGREAYEERFLPRIGPWALYGLLFTVVVLFALQGEAITSQPLDVARIAVPLVVYFALMWGGPMLLAHRGVWATNAPPASRSPQPATTSNLPSRSPSPSSASPAVRPWPGRSVPSSRYPSWSGWCMSACGPAASSPVLPASPAGSSRE